jgi:transposase-like protein
MPYTTNPHAPKVRWEAVKMLRSGKSSREVARYFGYDQSTVLRWAKKASTRNAGPIPTRSSRPHHNPNALPGAVVSAIISKRLEHDRCGQVVHQELLRSGVEVSLSCFAKDGPFSFRKTGAAYPTNVRALPDFDPRPVRPMRWM